MFVLKLNDSEIDSIAHHLRVAADKYLDNARDLRKLPGYDQLAELFEQQAEAAVALAAKIALGGAVVDGPGASVIGPTATEDDNSPSIGIGGSSPVAVVKDAIGLTPNEIAIGLGHNFSVGATPPSDKIGS